MTRPAQDTLNWQDTHQPRIMFSFNDTFPTWRSGPQDNLLDGVVVKITFPLMKSRAIPQKNTAHIAWSVRTSDIDKHYSWYPAESVGGTGRDRISVHFFKVVQKFSSVIEIIVVGGAFYAPFIRLSHLMAWVQIESCAHAQYTCVVALDAGGGNVERLEHVPVAV